MFIALVMNFTKLFIITQLILEGFRTKPIGSSLLTEKDTSKKTEEIIIGNIVNLWNSFGRCESVKIG